MSNNSPIVMKFGGTSVRNDSARTNSMLQVKKHFENNQKIVVVVSAMGRKGEPYSTDTLINLLKIEGASVCPKELDAVMSVGEILSAAYFAHFLSQNGMPAISFNGSQAGILTDDNAGNAEIININPSRIKSALNEGKIVVVAGFQGVNKYGDIRTLGRGGSDTSAVALGSALKAAAVEIYSDVDGIANCDPRQIANVKFMRSINAKQMLKLAEEGSKVIHSRAIKASFKNKIPIIVKNTFNNNPGTKIFHDQSENNKCIAIANRDDMVVVEFEHPHNKTISIDGVINIDSKRVILKDDIYFSANLSKLEENFGFYKISKGWSTISIVFNNTIPKVCEIEYCEIIKQKDQIISYLMSEEVAKEAINKIYQSYIGKK